MPIKKNIKFKETSKTLIQIYKRKIKYKLNSINLLKPFLLPDVPVCLV